MKNDTNSTIRSSDEVLIDDLRALVDEAERVVADPEDSESKIDSLRRRLNQAQAKVADLYTGAKDRVISGAKSTDSAIRENPYQSLAIALGAGLLIGALLMRKSNSSGSKSESSRD